MANRLWNLWCELSGTDPEAQALKFAFNTDPRVARLSALDPEVVERCGSQVWRSESTEDLETLLGRWLDEAVAADANLNAERMADTLRLREARHAERRRAADARAALEAERERLARAAAEAPMRERMRRISETAARIRNLYNIAPVSNLASIMELGILCHARAADVRHDDVSNRGVQRHRERAVVDSRPLHEFANLYFNPRNAMLHSLGGQDLVVLRIAKSVLHEPGVCVTDRNAGSTSFRWWNCPDGLAEIDLDLVYSEWWDGDDDLKKIMQAEVLVPHVVPPRFIAGAIAPTRAVQARVRALAPNLECELDNGQLFRSGHW